MKQLKLFIFLFFLLGINISNYAQNDSTKTPLISFEIEEIQNKYRIDINKPLEDLNSISAYLDTLIMNDKIIKQRIDTSVYNMKIESLNGIEGRVYKSLKAYNDSLDKFIELRSRMNRYEMNKLYNDNKNQRHLVKVLKDSLFTKDTEKIINYIEKNNHERDSLTALIAIQIDALKNYSNTIKQNHKLSDLVKILKYKLGEYTNKNIGWGLSATYSYDATGIYKYSVNSDSTLFESKEESGHGGMLSLVVYFNLADGEKSELYGIINMPFIDYSSITGLSSIFNQKTPLGFGLGYSSGKMPVILTAMINVSTNKRLNEGKRNSNAFVENTHEFIDLDNYSKYTNNEFKVFFNAGVIFPFGNLFKRNKGERINIKRKQKTKDNVGSTVY